MFVKAKHQAVVAMSFQTWRRFVYPDMTNAFCWHGGFPSRGENPDLISFELEFVQSAMCVDCEVTTPGLYSELLPRNDHPDSEKYRTARQSLLSFERMKPEDLHCCRLHVSIEFTLIVHLNTFCVYRRSLLRCTNVFNTSKLKTYIEILTKTRLYS